MAEKIYEILIRQAGHLFPFPLDADIYQEWMTSSDIWPEPDDTDKIITDIRRMMDERTFAPLHHVCTQI